MKTIWYIDVSVSYKLPAKSKKEAEMRHTKKLDMPSLNNTVDRINKSEQELNFIKSKLPNKATDVRVFKVDVIGELGKSMVQ